MTVYSWDDLSRAEQRSVLRLARKGRTHPDRRVARVAREWATEVLEREGSVPAILVGTIAGLVLGSDTGVGLSLTDRRRATRILRAVEASRVGRRYGR
ncbi:hypothetical protein [Trujillonella endophytica]|uniref:Uncharacterized protein n=1 Tax=Trujillonella endophytica TaxID=673521 RepID=A0A1H8RTU6_9ACTN|nr:hypothetical protein [Trujillella endophytica]SEO69588.1 hypothetical protein SAMN05660991_01318 [Trujillella endophytica]